MFPDPEYIGIIDRNDGQKLWKTKIKVVVNPRDVIQSESSHVNQVTLNENAVETFESDSHKKAA